MDDAITQFDLSETAFKATVAAAIKQFCQDTGVELRYRYYDYATDFVNGLIDNSRPLDV